MKYGFISLALSTLLLISCNPRDISCYSTYTDAYPNANLKGDNIETIRTVNSGITFSFDPLILPAKLVYSPSSGWSVEGSTSLVTPIGVFESEMNVNSVKAMSVNGKQINGGDFVVSLINRNYNAKEIFAIREFSNLKLVLVGKTIVKAQQGLVEIDVTDVETKEISFIDNNRMAIINTTPYEVNFAMIIKKTSTNKTDRLVVCSIPPLSHKFTSDWVSKYGGDESSGYHREIATVISQETKLIRPKVRLGYSVKATMGSTIYILKDAKRKELYLQKRD